MTVVYIYAMPERTLAGKEMLRQRLVDQDPNGLFWLISFTKHSAFNQWNTDRSKVVHGDPAELCNRLLTWFWRRLSFNTKVAVHTTESGDRKVVDRAGHLD